MSGPFEVKFLDYFGIEHVWHVWAQTTDEAIRYVSDEYQYPIEVITAKLDWEAMIHPWKKVWES